MRRARYGGFVEMTNGHNGAHASGAGWRLLAELMPRLQPLSLREHGITGIDDSWFAPPASLDDILTGDLKPRVVLDEEVDDNVPVAPAPRAEERSEVGNNAHSILTRRQPTPVGNALCLVDRAGYDIRYVSKRGWYGWNGKFWERDDETHRVHRACVQLCRDMRDLADALDGGSEESERKKARYRNYWLGAEAHIGQMKIEASHLPELELPAQKLDVDPFLLNCHNGTIDLQDKSIRKHTRSDYITKIAPVAYDANAQAPRWLQFLADIHEGDEETVSYLQKAIGYGMTGVVREHVLFILWGPPRSGRTTLIEMVCSLLGDDTNNGYSTVAPASMFSKMKNGRFDTGDIAGARFVQASELDEDERLSTSLINRITGGDTVRDEEKFKQSVVSRPRYKLFMRTNDIPPIKNDATWARVVELPYYKSFLGRENFKLPEELQREREGIFAWMVEGAYRYAREGLGRPPARARAAKAESRGVEDPFTRFLRERMKFEPDAHIEKVSFQKALDLWTEGQKLPLFDHREIQKRLRKRGIFTGHSGSEKRWNGVRLRTTLDEALDD